jgi:hypothetical protein
MTAALSSFNTDKESTMITLYDHIQELRAELRGCGFTRSERAAVQAELARAVAERAELERTFDLALEALQPARASGPRERPFLLQQLYDWRTLDAAPVSPRNPAHRRAADAGFARHHVLRRLGLCSPDLDYLFTPLD